MSNQVLMQKKNGKYLWFALLGLGFQPDAEIAGKTNHKHINLGPNMFVKPNKDAFYIVTHFLLEKLNPNRFHEAYRHCWPVVNNKEDAEFRKVTCAWLRELMDETANARSKVVASLFLSPGGPKFTSLMLNLANHVMLQEMKTFTTGGSWVPEAAAMPASSVDMAVKRRHLVKATFLKGMVDQDRFLHEYQRRAQVLIKSERDLRADGAKYDELLKCHSSDSTQLGASLPEKTKIARSLWSTIDGMLSSTQEGQQVLKCVLKGTDQYRLDGKDWVLKVPQSLLERVEHLPHQLSSGNVYEAGQLNLLCVMELMNHALQLLKEERHRVSDAAKPQLGILDLQEKSQQMARMLQDLHLLKQKISKEEIPEVKGGIRKLMEEWDGKWMDTLKDTPLVSFLNDDPAFGFLSPMAQLSFEPAADGRGVFSQFPARLPERSDCQTQPGIKPSCSSLKSLCPATDKSEGAVMSESSQADSSLDWLFDTPPLRTPSAPPQVREKAAARVCLKAASMRTKTEILDMEYENLADQFADAVTTTSPAKTRAKGLDLEGILTTLHGDPFSTRKQLPRTPESLILDVKSSWRKAVEDDKAEKMRQHNATGWLTPLGEPYDQLLASPHSVPSNRSPIAKSHSSPPVSRQGVSLPSPPSWSTTNTESINSPSGTGSSAVQFSLDQETLPEMSSCDSLLSLGNDSHLKCEADDEPLAPFRRTEATQSPPATRRHLHQFQQSCNNGSFTENLRTSECTLLDHIALGLDLEWPAKSDSANKVFSLDLDSFDATSPQKECSLPQLITFSPIDDMKC
ncbi:HAUS augmin-like complex subunit 6 [Aulostomus maculatus]